MTDIDDIGRIFEQTLASRGFSHFASPSVIERLSSYYRIVIKWNERLHLTTIVAAKAFAIRHICEALEVESRIDPDGTELWDIGSGLGIPGIPISIVRPELRVVLVESSRHKAIFLEEAVRELGLFNVRVVNLRFDPAMIPEGAVLSARAVEKMKTLVASFLDAPARQTILLGAEDLFDSIHSPYWQISRVLLDGTQTSYIFDLHPNVPRGT